jgi:hypothetical protein
MKSMLAAAMVLSIGGAQNATQEHRFLTIYYIPFHVQTLVA